MPLRRTLLFVACFFAAFLLCALVTGGSRLLADGEPAERQQADQARPVMPAALCPAVFAPSPEPSAPLRQAVVTNAEEARDLHTTAQARLNDGAPVRDANGNVLQRGRYIQAVYHAFALEDAGG